MTAEREMAVSVVRRDPETGMKPKKVKYIIPYADKMRVMDALNYVQ